MAHRPPPHGPVEKPGTARRRCGPVLAARDDAVAATAGLRAQLRAGRARSDAAHRPTRLRQCVRAQPGPAGGVPLSRPHGSATRQPRGHLSLVARRRPAAAVDGTRAGHARLATGLEHPAPGRRQRQRAPVPKNRFPVTELRTIARHAATVLVGQLAVMAFGVTDTIVAGRYSQQALAALSVGSAVYISVFVGLMGMLQALLPTWAELHGGERHHDVGRSVRQSLYLGAFGMLAGGWALLSPGPLLRWTEVQLQ